MEIISDTYINRHFRIRVHYFKGKREDGTNIYFRSKMITARKVRQLMTGRYNADSKLLKAIESKTDRVRIERKEYFKIDFYVR